MAHSVASEAAALEAWYALLADLSVKDAVYSLAIAQQYRMFHLCRESQDSQEYEFQQRG
jgi:hypothetical protein